MTHKTQLEALYSFEKTRKDDVWLTQPMADGSVKDITFGQAMDEARRMAAHLGTLGLPAGSKIALFAKNNAWWMIADIAIWMAGHTSVPLYPTLTPETIGQILGHSEAKLIFIGKLDGFEAMAPGIPAGLPRIALPLAPKLDAPKWEEIIQKTEPMKESPVRPASDLATIIYTSGSTGVPKGVMHSFATMCASRGFADSLHLTKDDRMLSYLPLAHAFERTLVETMTFLVGFHVYFAQSLDTFVEDIKRARPTMFISVPRLWQRFQTGVYAKMPPGKLNFYLKVPILAGIVRKKVLTNLGLQDVRFAGSGSAPIPASLIDWYRSLGLELLEGYGMSENFSYSHMTQPGEVRVGYVGTPQMGCEHKISEAGEILVKSPATMVGYYKEPAMSAEMLTPDGFLKTGDRGDIDEKNRLRITGRVKELFKTSKGKYVAPSPIENKLLTHPDVEQACVAGANHPQPFGMVVLSPGARAKAKDPAGKAALEETLKAHLSSINEGLDQHENLETIVVIPDEWTTENGMLTPTMKLKRGAVEDRYGKRTDEWYGMKKPVIWA